MNTTLKTFRMVEAEPHPLVSKALNAELFQRCGIENPVPVHFIPLGKSRGYCRAKDYTAEGEVQLADSLLSWQKTEEGMLDGLALIYLHELSHRLTPWHGHDPAFLAVNALLLMRAGNDRHDGPHLFSLDVYDMQDYEGGSCTIGAALDWAFDQANELAGSDKTAEACAAEIIQRFEKWRTWNQGAEERAEAAEASKRRTVAAFRELQGKASEHRKNLVAAILGGLMVGFVAALALVY